MDEQSAKSADNAEMIAATNLKENISLISEQLLGMSPLNRKSYLGSIYSFLILIRL